MRLQAILSRLRRRMPTLKHLLITALLVSALPAQAGLRVLACEPEWAQLAEEIAGDLVTVKSASAPGQDAHHLQARPSLLAQVRRADMVLCTGAGLEQGWLPVLLNRGGNPDVRKAPGLFFAAEQVERLEVPAKLDRAEGDVHAMGNPHVHLDPHRLMRVSQQLAQHFATLDPDHADQYRQRQQQWEAHWREQVGNWEQRAEPLRGMTVITHHRDWRYLLDWLGMARADELEPKPGLPPTPSHLAKLVDTVTDQQAKLILYRELNGDDAANWLAKRSPACAVLLPFSPGEMGTESLASLYEHLVSTLLTQQERCDD